ncbi:hypothetical protein [Endozoicomonas sp.]|uniref:hypothetical protein n=1 Tax=Endozoicomonas sp. TaxID=1892382 RepID=UPI003AF86394
MLNSLFRPSVQPYMISWVQYDPAIEVAKLKIPTLIIQGSTDLQVGIHDAEFLATASPKAQKVIIQGMNHVLKDSATEASVNLETSPPFFTSKH